MAQPTWWRGAVIYEIYPRSFNDSNADGIGDLQGIIERLDYVASLGVDAIWIAPFFQSPMADFGYDVSDYRSVDPMFGDLQDFDRLLARAHAHGLRVIIDQVLSHTSNEHAWFKESRSSRDNPKTDWYVWADPKEDGTPPNNWLSIFGGVAWQWEPRRRQYYLHNFLASQPDLNFHHPQVCRAVLDNLRFWLDRGVDGLRLDAINFCFHDTELRNNPPKPAALRKSRAFSPENPYAYQYHHFDNSRPENLLFLNRLRALLDEYPGTVSLGEVSSEDSLASMAEYTRESRLHMAYSFELLSEDSSAEHLRTTVSTLESHMSEGWPCWALSNHDVRRVVTRWGGANPPATLANQLLALLCSLRGSICLYQGEELGLPEASLPYHALRDPYGIAFYPNFRGRDGCRTPMPWSEDAHAGFSTAVPWLPVPEEHRVLCVSRQQADENSVLNRFREFLRWRKNHPALLHGEIQVVPTPEPVFAFERRLAEEHLLLCFNLSPHPAALEVPYLNRFRQIDSVGLVAGELSGEVLRMPPSGVVIAHR
jgi:alpha-glucosidase